MSENDDLRREALRRITGSPKGSAAPTYQREKDPYPAVPRASGFYSIQGPPWEREARFELPIDSTCRQDPCRGWHMSRDKTGRPYVVRCPAALELARRATAAAASSRRGLAKPPDDD